ncbi:sublitisin-like protease [Cordyceps fumosorosea ARSEF 2679]|uniref:Sublitisin-like protease n=1 Tax=Cordyceps fumosorosea (strain ARSEF 2679) TaxID=1081104 RepID=A0A162MLU5_CORFA|nr:sublitisin-like protease [Cordyceps fumosorosea ARSEF 2679]OAA63900.1 sublitisin-like protease [Cordyceps fumosorosea ARSEF 2679]
MKSVVAALSVVAIAQASSFKIGTIHHDSAPILDATNANTIPGAYIIKFKDHVDEPKAKSHHAWVSDIHSDGEQQRLELRKRGLFDSVEDAFAGMKHSFDLGSGFRGYSGHFDDAVIEQIRNHPDVEAIERDSIVHTTVPVTTKHAVTDDTCKHEEEKQAPWGLARISHRDTLGFSTFNKYLYAEEGGQGVDAYVIDTGTNIDHVDFEGRAQWGYTAPDGDADEDGNGHGTHCSGTIAGKKYGVAKKANVYAVKVLRSNGSGTMSDVIKGVDWAAKKHEEQVQLAKDGKRKGFKGSVANMSLGGGKTTLLDLAVDAAVDKGLHFAVAAGNDNADACNYSPAAAKKAVTVGASTIDDSRAYFSNTGKCTDIFAPGLNIQSTWIGSKYAINTISGTSMASPHICGLLAYYLSLQPAADSEYAVAAITPAELKESIINIGTKNTLSDVGSGSPNVLAWNGAGCNDYKKIVEAGSYDAKRTSSKTENIHTKIQHEFEVVSGEITKSAKTFGSKAEKFAKKIQHIVDAEVEDFLSHLE